MDKELGKLLVDLLKVLPKQSKENLALQARLSRKKAKKEQLKLPGFD